MTALRTAFSWPLMALSIAVSATWACTPVFDPLVGTHPARACHTQEFEDGSARTTCPDGTTHVRPAYDSPEDFR